MTKKTGTHHATAPQPAGNEDLAAQLTATINELAYENREKEKRAAELLIANKELAYQNEEKEKRAAELLIANKELAYQNEEKEKRAAELLIANKELAYQNEEKEKRAAELLIANEELAYQNSEKEKRAAELLIANKELESFTFISSHDLQEPLRKIQSFANRLIEEESGNLSEKGKYYLERTRISASHMQNLINDLLTYSRTNEMERKFESTDLNNILEDVMGALTNELKQKGATIEVKNLGKANVISFQFKQLLYNLISNSLKFAKPGVAPYIIIKSSKVKYNPATEQTADFRHLSINDNGIGIEDAYKDKIFDIFQRLHDKADYEGTGIGLTIARKIVENHNGFITATGELGKGTTLDIYIPEKQ